MKKRAFVSAIAMLIVSAIVLTSSTFAWFSMAKRVEVETMQLNITSPDGVQISANTNAFTTKLTVNDFKREIAEGQTKLTRFAADADNTNNFPDVLSPSSSAFNVTARNLPKFFQGSIDDSGKAWAEEKTDANGAYVVFDLFVKLGAAAKVYWDETTVQCTDNPDVPTAMRIAMVNCGSGDKTTAKTVTSNIAANGANRSIEVFEPDSLNHTEASGYTDGATERTLYVHSAYKDVNPIGTNKNVVDGTSRVQALGCTTLTEETARSNFYFNGAAGINRVRVYIWMEGQDVDCANDVAGSAIDVNLVLTID